MQKKILQFTIAETMGGRTQYIFNIWRHIDKSIITFDFVTFSTNISFAKELLEDGCKVYQIKNHPNNNMQGFIKEFNCILENKYDAIEIHTSYWESTIVEELAKKHGIKKIIVHAHSSGTKFGRTKEDIQASAERILNHETHKKEITPDLATDYWACSEAASRWLFEPQIPSNRILILHNTIDTKRFKYAPEIRNEMRRKLDINEPEIVIGFTGRLEPVKNIRFILDVISSAVQKSGVIKLLIVGDGTLRRELEEYCKSKSIANNVIFTGRVNRVEDYLQCMDIFVLSSYYEGFPLSLLEAECAGLKCIASDAITREINVLGNISYLPLEIEEWVNEIDSFSFGINRGKCAQELKQKGFDTETEIKNIQDLYQK